MESVVRSGDVTLVNFNKALIRSSVEANEWPRGEASRLLVAIRKGYQDIALALLEKGAYVHVKDRCGWTALHWACYKGLEEVVQAIIRIRSEVNERGTDGRTPLILAQEAWSNKAAISMHLLRAAKG